MLAAFSYHLSYCIRALSLPGLTVADTIEAYILSEPQQLPSSSSTITIKVQGKGGYRDFVNVAMHDDEPMSECGITQCTDLLK